ncbi:MAG: hypothetical protein HQM03_11195 [Magnetococcales bacterium]|nr:hypothetical protein [Magnetococcales bacterium]
MTAHPTLRSLSRRGGYTIMELMVALTLTLLLSAVLFKIILLSQHMADIMITQTTQNAEARLLFDMLKDGREGGALNGYPGNHKDTASTAIWSRSNLRLCLGSTTAVCSRAIQPVTITCASANDRLASCTGSGTTVTMDGYVDAASASTQRNVENRTSEVTFTIIDPYRVPVDGVEAQFIRNEYSTSYWTLFNRYVDQ